MALSWQVDGETVETVTDFILGGSEITADGDGSHEIKRRLLLGIKVMTNPDSILKSRDIILEGSKITADCDCSHEITSTLRLPCCPQGCAWNSIQKDSSSP